MKVVIQLQTGEERTYENADHVVEKDKHSLYVYGEDNRVLAIVSKGDIRNLLTEDAKE